MSMSGLGIASYAGIVAVCYVVGIFVNNTKYASKWTNIACLIAGALLGVIAYYTGVPIGAANWLDAMATGIASGLAATGVYELGKNVAKDAKA